MNQQTKLLFITAGFAALSACGGGGSDSPTPAPAPALAPAPAPATTQAPALAPIAAPDYLVTDSSCVAIFAPSGISATAGKIDDVAAYFGSYAVSLSLGGTATLTLQNPGTATLRGVTLNMQSVCMAAVNGVNWRRVSFTNGDAFNVDVTRVIGAVPGINGTDFSSTTLPRGRFEGRKL